MLKTSAANDAAGVHNVQKRHQQVLAGTQETQPFRHRPEAGLGDVTRNARKRRDEMAQKGQQKLFFVRSVKIQKRKKK